MKVAVVIPCRNEKKYIGKCLDSLIHSTYPKDKLDVFVCDGLSDDGTTEIIKDYEKKFPFIHLLINEKRTTPFALNMGLKASDADVKIILGAHAEIYPDYIERCLESFAFDAAIGCTGGLIENVIEDQTTEMISMAMSSPFGVGNAHFRTGQKDGFVDTVAFGAYAKRVFESVGYFDEDLIRNQDDEFNFRLTKAGFKVYLNRNIRSKYYVRASFLKLFKQYYQYGYWKVFVNVKHQTVTTVRQLIPAMFVLFVFSGTVASLFCQQCMYLFASGLGFYFLSALLFAFRTGGRISQIPGVVYTFLILHTGYGLGYLEGIIDFVMMRKKPGRRQQELSR